MPVTAQIGGIGWNRHHMAGTGRDIAIAAGAQVVLVRFVRLNPANLGISPEIELRSRSPHPNSTQMTRAIDARTAAPTNQ